MPNLKPGDEVLLNAWPEWTGTVMEPVGQHSWNIRWRRPHTDETIHCSYPEAALTLLAPKVLSPFETAVRSYIQKEIGALS